MAQNSLVQAYNQTYKEMCDLYHEIAQNMGLSDSAFDVLYAMCELKDGCLQKDICDHSYLTKQTVHSAVRKLIGQEVLRTESGKGRDMHLFLTEKGRALAERTVKPLMEQERTVFASMTPEEGQTLVRLTQKYVSLLREKTTL